MGKPFWRKQRGDEPIVAMAIHDGHEVRDEVGALLALSDADRLREEDPFTGEWAGAFGTHVVVSRSRFEVDLNRPRKSAVYRRPEDAWGLDVWRREPPDEIIARSLGQYDAFYRAMRRLMGSMVKRFGRFVVLDLHSYNHRRTGPDGPPSDEADNPQVNVGTGSLDRGRWAPVVDRFMSHMQSWPFPGGKLDVRENVKFRGGQLSRWVHQRFPESACCLAVEFKKFFMDEWTGQPNRALVDMIGEALLAASPGLVEELRRL
ncbi:MAG TPA: N-formylglutamate amidohydrolase [Phycisphaerae bacterium]|nr:N-formylglutamate amidohydrolase [Phycisphaerae bacterium]